LVRLASLFLRPDLSPDGHRAQASSMMAEGHREAARSVIDEDEQVAGWRQVGAKTTPDRH